MAALILVAGDSFAGDAALGRDKAAFCAPCHGADGISRFADVPHLAAQSEVYLISALKNFRRAGLGHFRPEQRRGRNDAVMAHQATGLTDGDIQNLAAYFSSLACPAPTTVIGAAKPTLARRCVSCHGAAGRSGTATVPRLAAQRPGYLENQLRAFRDAGDSAGPGGKRRERFHPIMNRQAEPLADEDIGRLARYFAAQSCR